MQVISITVIKRTEYHGNNPNYSFNTSKVFDTILKEGEKDERPSQTQCNP